MTEESGPRCIGVQPNDDAILWRYMDFHQLYDLLTLKQLTFVSPRLFDDRFEGRYSSARYQRYLDSISAGDINQLENDFRILWFLTTDSAANNTIPIYISCWHQADSENMSMWERYAGRQHGVAVKTTYQKLKKLLPDYSYLIGTVNYDESDFEPHAVKRFFYKLDGFKDEKELRILYHTSYNADNENNEIHSLEVDPQKFIDEIVPSPFSESLYQSVAKLSGEYGIKIVKSRLSWENVRIFDKVDEDIKRALAEIALDCDKCGNTGHGKLKSGKIVFCPHCVKSKKDDFFERLNAIVNENKNG